MRPPELTDGTVRLRALREDDIGTGEVGERSILAQCHDPESIRWTTVPLDYTAEQAREFVELAATGWAASTGFVLAIADADDDTFLGSLDLRPRAPGAYGIGFGLGPAGRGRGVMARALALALGWAFDTGGLAARVVRWEANVGNWVSRRTAWRAGFRGFVTVRGLLDHRGEAVDAWVATVRADEVGRPDGRWIDVPTLPVTARDGAQWVLRAWRDDEADLAAITRACGDPVSQRWLSHLPRGFTVADARDSVARRAEGAAAGDSFSVALAPAAGGPGVLSVNVFDIGAPYGTPKFGWWADPAVRGRGLVAAAVRATADWMFHAAPDGVRTHRVECAAEAGNEASVRVALAAGFTEFGRGHAEDPDPAGGWSDCRYFELLRADAAAQRVPGGG